MKKLTPEDHYEYLRSAHSNIKMIFKEDLKGIPVFFGKERELPKKYSNILKKIDSLLYDAEEEVCKEIN